MIARLPIALLALAAGFYVGTFAYRLVTHVLYAVSMFGLIVLHIFDLPITVFAAPAWFFGEASENAPARIVAGVLCAGAASWAVWRVGRRSERQRTLLAAGALLAAVAGVAFAIDLRYTVTTVGEHLAPTTSFATAEQSVTCRPSVREITSLPDKMSGCVAEVEGLLVYSNSMRRFELQATDAERASIRVSFIRGERTLFTEVPPGRPPRYFDQVQGFVDKRVRVIGAAVNGAVSVDVGHIVIVDPPAN